MAATIDGSCRFDCQATRQCLRTPRSSLLYLHRHYLSNGKSKRGVWWHTLCYLFRRWWHAHRSKQRECGIVTHPRTTSPLSFSITLIHNVKSHTSLDVNHSSIAHRILHKNAMQISQSQSLLNSVQRHVRVRFMSHSVAPLTLHVFREINEKDERYWSNF